MWGRCPSSMWRVTTSTQVAVEYFPPCSSPAVEGGFVEPRVGFLSFKVMLAPSLLTPAHVQNSNKLSSLAISTSECLAVVCLGEKLLYPNMGAMT